jgi:ribosomal protein L11 methyltransferase
VRLTFWSHDDAEAAHGESTLRTLARVGDLVCEPQADDWNDGWKAFHRAVSVAGVTLRAPWHEPVVGTLDVVVDVGMAFGTGAHPTTRGCVAALAALEPGSLADLGTGSGVLALAALRLGFAPVWACDNDAEAVAAARDNARRNGLELDVVLADCLDPGVGLPDVEVVVANLLLAPIVGLGARLSRVGATAPRPRAIVLSGLLVEQAPAAEAAFRGFRRRDLATDGEWATLVLGPPGV